MVHVLKIIVIRILSTLVRYVHNEKQYGRDRKTFTDVTLYRVYRRINRGKRHQIIVSFNWMRRVSNVINTS